MEGTADSYSWVTVTTRIPIYWDDISGEKVQVFRDLIKTTWKFLSHKGISFSFSNTLESYMIFPFVIQAHFDLLLLWGKSDFYKIMGIPSPCLPKNVSVWRFFEGCNYAGTLDRSLWSKRLICVEEEGRVSNKLGSQIIPLITTWNQGVLYFL